LTISVHFWSSHPDVYKVFLDLIAPILIKRLDINSLFGNLVDLPPLNVEEFAIAEISSLQVDKVLKASPFMDKTRHICIKEFSALSEVSDPGLKELFMSWHQLRSFEFRSRGVPLSTWLCVWGQSVALQNLEQCHLTTSNAGSGPLVGICMPNLRWLALILVDVLPDIVIPLIAAPNITTLRIASEDNWSPDTYDIIKQHYKLHQLHQIGLESPLFSLRIGQILADAPMIYRLVGRGKLILDAEAQEGIADGRLGRCLTTLRIEGCIDNAGEWLDMIETRQRNVKSMVAQVSNWREMFTGIKSVNFWGMLYSRKHYEGRVAALEALGSTVKIHPRRTGTRA
jgi:hypothetical protein